MVEFPRSINIAACEEVLANLYKDSDTELMLPVDTTQTAFGGLATAIQVVNTWGRNSKSRILNIRKATPVARISNMLDGTSIKESPDDARKRVYDEQMHELISKPHKFTAAMFAQRIEFDQLPDIDIRSIVNINASEAIERQANSNYGQHHGGLCWFAFVDHSSRGFDKNFYLGRNPKRPEHIQTIIRAMVEKSSATVHGKQTLSGNKLDYLGRTFYELFLNTHEHGSRDRIRSDWLRPGLRIIYTNAIKLSDVALEKAVKGKPVLSTYLNSSEIASNKRFIEISIIDSGLGYCNRWCADHSDRGLDKSLTLRQEYEILKTCFLFRKTSTGIDTKGHGLPVVLDRLTKLKSFIRIRSGRLALFRDLIASPYTDSESESCDFADWNTQESASTNLTEMPEVVGTAITFLIPLETIS